MLLLKKLFFFKQLIIDCRITGHYPKSPFYSAAWMTARAKCCSPPTPHPAEESAPPKEMRIASGRISGWTLVHIYREMVTGLLQKMTPISIYRKNSPRKTASKASVSFPVHQHLFPVSRIQGLKPPRVTWCCAPRRTTFPFLFISIKTHLPSIKGEFLPYKPSSPSTGNPSLL